MPVLASIHDIYRVRVSATGIIKRAMRLLGAIATGEELAASELADGVEALNHMLDSWNTEALTIYALVKNTFALTAGQNPHTIGPAGNLDAPRPQKIEEGLVAITGGSLGTNETLLRMLTAQEWAAILDKTNSTIPADLYYESSFPLGNVWLYPKPDAAYSLILYQEQMLAQAFLDSVGSDIALPPGYAEAIVQNLAVRLAPEFGKAAPPEVIEGAVSGKANIKRANMKPMYLACDTALVSPGRWDITTGDFV